MECRNPSNHTLADSPGAKDNSKTSKLGPDLPLGVHNQPQCAEIGANPFTLLLGPNQRKPGTRYAEGVGYEPKVPDTGQLAHIAR